MIFQSIYFYLSIHNIQIIHSRGWISENLLANMRDNIAINFIKIFNAGPEVSFRGSQTVSPTTAALWIYDPFLTTAP